MGTISEAYPHLIFDRFSSKLGTRVASILKYLFPPPKPDAKRVVTFANKVRIAHNTRLQPRTGTGLQTHQPTCVPHAPHPPTPPPYPTHPPQSDYISFRHHTYEIAARGQERGADRGGATL